MAGLLLFHVNKPQLSGIFNAKYESLKHYFSQNFSEYFPSIQYIQPDKQTGLILFGSSKDSFYNDKDGNWLGFEGNVFALHETIKYSASSLWDLYKKQGPDFVDKLDGHFVIKLYDAEKDKFHILTDFIRSRHNYMVANEEYFMFTPFLLSAGIIVEPELDFEAINEIMWRYYILSERTILKNVKRLPPATIFTIHNNQISQRTYWQFPKQPTKENLNSLVEKFTNSIQETARLIGNNFSEVVSDLTLGQDSRILTAAFRKQDISVTTTTFGREDFLESRGVRELAEHNNITNIPIFLTEQYTGNLWHYFKKAILLGNCDEPGYLLGRILFMRSEQRRYGSAIINGAGGPFYKDCFWEEIYIFNLYRESYKIDPNRFLKLRPMNKNYHDSFFSDDFLQTKQQSAEYFLNMLQDSIQGYEDCPVSMQIDKFAITQWQNYTIFANSVANSLYNGFSPLLFRRNVEISLPIPAKHRWNKSNFQRHVMYQLDPSLAKEKTDFGGINMVPKNMLTFIPFYFRYAYKQSERYRNKLKNKLGLHPKTWLQEAWDYKPLYQKLLQSDEHRALLENDLLISPLLNHTNWKTFTDTIGRSEFDININLYEALFKLSGIELFLQNIKQLNKR